MSYYRQDKHYKKKFDWVSWSLLELATVIITAIQVASAYFFVDIICEFTITWGTILFGFFLVSYLVKQDLKKELGYNE